LGLFFALTLYFYDANAQGKAPPQSPGTRNAQDTIINGDTSNAVSNRSHALEDMNVSLDPEPKQKSIPASPPQHIPAVNLLAQMLPPSPFFLTKSFGNITAVLDTNNGRFGVYS